VGVCRFSRVGRVRRLAPFGAAFALLLVAWAARAQVTNDCDPPCRAGFLCSNARCISACNPPCAQNEKCTADARCVPRAGSILPGATSSLPGASPEPPVAPAAPAPPPAPPPLALAAPPPPPQEDSERTDKARRAKFSAGRFIVESLIGGAVGSAVSYGVYTAACGDTPCIGGALGGLVSDIAATPLAAYGFGELMGGDGNLGTTYLVGLAAFGGGAAATSDDAVVILAIGMVLEPFCAALGYELSSGAKAKSILGPTGWVQPGFSPTMGPGRSASGGTFNLTGGF
jgi:hypothetical protein